MSQNLTTRPPCTCEPWAPDEACPVHGDHSNPGPGLCCWVQAPDGPKPCIESLCHRTSPPAGIDRQTSGRPC